jgi:hypothetical protein
MLGVVRWFFVGGHHHMFGAGGQPGRVGIAHAVLCNILIGLAV